MELKAGSVGHLAISSALRVLRGVDCREALETTFGRLSAEDARLFCKELIAQKVFPVVARAIELQGVCLPEEVACYKNAMTGAADRVLRLYEREIASFAKEMRTHSAPVLMLKGIDLAENVWPQLPRVMADLDVLVQPSQLEEAKAAWRSLGYQQGFLNRAQCAISPFYARSEIRALDEDHYEIGIFRRIVRVPEMDDRSAFLAEHWRNNFFHIGNATYLVLEVDLHYSVLREISAVEMWNHPRVVARNGEDIFALSAENLLSIIALRCYLESMTTKENVHPIHLFLDTLAVLVKFSAELNWDEIERWATQHKFISPLYYVLRHANEVLGEAIVPENYLMRWQPRNPGNDRSRDFGDFVPRLFDHLEFIPLQIA
jgi:Uncharacterised nucleotidyltransferase